MRLKGTEQEGEVVETGQRLRRGRSSAQSACSVGLDQVFDGGLTAGGEAASRRKRSPA
ncbi:MAG: hypothetical protein MZU91_02690 [Desulfosudis oleivorans]|nr:hypothetical protein [Desulfosudis oleivorans]